MYIPYKNFTDGSRHPFATLTLKGPVQRGQIEAFVDTGADFSIFHAGWIEKLGFSKKRAIQKKIQVGDGDYIRAWLLNIEVEFYGDRFMAPVTFSDQLGLGFSLLGRAGFFNRFRFCFDDKHFQLSLTRL